MKVELYYDPVRPATSVVIDGRPVDRHNVYGFLYPVRRCVLQTWLPTSGSWSGLKRQLTELARGERVDLTFHGRLVDYKDIRAELGDQVAFEQDEHIQDAYRSLLNRTEQGLRDISQKKVEVSSEPAILRSGSDLFQEQFAELERILLERGNPWLFVVDSEEAFSIARRGEGCCLVREPFLSGFVAIDRLPQLTVSMRRSRDMILCCVDDENKRAELSAYAKQFPQCSVPFVSGVEDNWREKLSVKYGEPFLLRQRLGRAIAAFKAAEQCWLEEDRLSEQHKALKKAVRNGDTLKVMQRNQMAYRLRWLQLQRAAIERLRKLLFQEQYGNDEGR